MKFTEFGSAPSFKSTLTICALGLLYTMVKSAVWPCLLRLVNNGADMTGSGALHKAATFGDFKIIDLMVNAGADLSARYTGLGLESATALEFFNKESYRNSRSDHEIHLRLYYCWQQRSTRKTSSEALIFNDKYWDHSATGDYAYRYPEFAIEAEERVRELLTPKDLITWR